MKIVLLGTGGTIPTPRRSLPSVALQREGDLLLFDCGEGTQIQLIRAALSPGKLVAIFLTHLHGDHVTGLPGLLMTMMHYSREKSLSVLGPPGTKEYLAMIRKCLGFNPHYAIEVRELCEGQVYAGDGFSVNAVTVDHKPLTFGFSLEEEFRAGRFFPEKAEERGVPEGPFFGRLQRGETVVLPNGTVVTPAMVMGPPRKGRKVVYVTDTRPCSRVVDFAREADLLIHEGMFASDMEEEAGIKGHSTVEQAAKTARDAQVAKFVITHLSSRYRQINQLLEEARKVFPQAIIGRDLMEFTIPLHK
jgi:ribonuclease Z